MITALIIAATKWSWAYHQLRRIGFTKAECGLIETLATDGRIVTGDVRYLTMLINNPTMRRL